MQIRQTVVKISQVDCRHHVEGQKLLFGRGGCQEACQKETSEAAKEEFSAMHGPLVSELRFLSQSCIQSCKTMKRKKK